MSDRNEPDKNAALDLERARAAARMVCELLGHDWRTVGPRDDSPLAAIFKPHTLCVRCCKLDR